MDFELTNLNNQRRQFFKINLPLSIYVYLSKLSEIIAELLRRKKPHSYFHFGTSNEMDDVDTIFKTLQCATLLLKSLILLGKVISHFIDIEIVSYIIFLIVTQLVNAGFRFQTLLFSKAYVVQFDPLIEPCILLYTMIKSLCRLYRDLGK